MEKMDESNFERNLLNEIILNHFSVVQKLYKKKN